jgi:hypothetical protein
MSKLPSPLHLAKWLSENEDKLKPPIGNYMLQVGHGTQVMAVGGPNARTDFHVNETEVLTIDICPTFAKSVVTKTLLLGMVLPISRKYDSASVCRRRF